MQSIKLKSHVGSDGILKIALPEVCDTDVEVIIVYQTVQNPSKRQWSPEFLSTFGAWQGEQLERATQEEQPDREAFL
jgi:hypothetical protein